MKELDIRSKLKEIGAWGAVMRLDALACEIRIQTGRQLTRDEWNKVGKALEELVYKIRTGKNVEDSHFKSAMWLLQRPKEE